MESSIITPAITLEVMGCKASSDHEGDWVAATKVSRSNVKV